MGKGLETDGDSDVLCACGCGLHLRKRQAERGGKFRNIAHANRWKGQHVLKGKKYNKGDKEEDFDMPVNGRKYCKNYLKNNLNCILCIENATFKVKPCYKEVR